MAFGSYSNWPVGMTLEKHQNLRANVGRLYFAGEAMSAQYYGFLQGERSEKSTSSSPLRQLILVIRNFNAATCSLDCRYT